MINALCLPADHDLVRFAAYVARAGKQSWIAPGAVALG
jgi:hypothetical protein